MSESIVRREWEIEYNLPGSSILGIVRLQYEGDRIQDDARVQFESG